MNSSYSISPRRVVPGYSASRASITRGLGPSSFSRAGPTMPANSGSVISTLASPWASMKAMASGSRRVLRVLSKAAAAGIGLAPGELTGGVHHTEPVRIDVGRTLEKAQGRQGHKVRSVLVQPDFIGIVCHPSLLFHCGRHHFAGTALRVFAGKPPGAWPAARRRLRSHTPRGSLHGDCCNKFCRKFHQTVLNLIGPRTARRSEERRVGKEC